MGAARRVPVLLAHGKNMPRGEGDGRVRRGLCWPRKTCRKRLRGGSSRTREIEERRDGKWRGGIKQDGDRRWEERRREREILVNHSDKMAGGGWEGAHGWWGKGFQVNPLNKVTESPRPA